MHMHIDIVWIVYDNIPNFNFLNFKGFAAYQIKHIFKCHHTLRIFYYKFLERILIILFVNKYFIVCLLFHLWPKI